MSKFSILPNSEKEMLAQSVEQLPFKQWVPGSSPGRLKILV